MLFIQCKTTSGMNNKFIKSNYLNPAGVRQCFAPDFVFVWMISRQEHVKDLWKNLRRNEPEMLGNFEDFIQRVCMDIRKAHLTTGELENALKT